MNEDLHYLSARELGTLLRKRVVSATDIVQAMLARIQTLDAKTNAYITVMAEDALSTARRCDAELATGQDRGPLHGIPVAVKDLYDTAGTRTTSGSKILADRVPEQDATSVARLRDAGAVIIGKTNLNEFACGVTSTNAHYGDVFNPWDLSRTPGGSSGGSAAAVAAGLCTMATGSDTGGSIRIPAALCGIVGFKPSYGRISCHGIMPLSWEQDHPGPMARTVHDTALMLSAMAGWDVADPATARQPVPDYALDLEGGIAGCRVGIDRQYALQGISSEVRSAFEQALETMVTLGAKVVDVQVPGLEEGISAGLVIWNAEATAVHEEWLRTRPEDYDPRVGPRLGNGFSVTGIEYARAQRARRQLVRNLQVLFEDVDLLATPMCAMGAPPQGASQVVVDGQEFDVLTGLTRYSRVFNLTGLPAISIPCGFTSDNLPIGLQLVGALYDEGTVLRAACAYEQTTEWHLRRPPLPD
jgi:aspartyl-tRNA(Asn)/glutamyl-tRNA(Gln) amidotransferase subunit A